MRKGSYLQRKERQREEEEEEEREEEKEKEERRKLVFGNQEARISKRRRVSAGENREWF